MARLALTAIRGQDLCEAHKEPEHSASATASRMQSLPYARLKEFKCRRTPPGKNRDTALGREFFAGVPLSFFVVDCADKFLPRAQLPGAAPRLSCRS